MDLKIERYELITVQTAQPNQYGDLLVNGTYKVGKKRSNLFDVFQVGAEVKLGYASYLNKEYIATAEQTGKHEVNHLVEAAKNLGAVPVDDIRTDGYKPPSGAPESKSTPVRQESDSRLRSMAISYAKDGWCNGMIPLEELEKTADRFLKYMEGR
jgi:hypothetical protein